MNFDTAFTEKNAEAYRAGLLPILSYEVLQQCLECAFDEVGEYSDEWRWFMTLELWSRQEQPERYRLEVREWLRALWGRQPSSPAILFVWSSIRNALTFEQGALFLESIPVGTWKLLIRPEVLPSEELDRLRMMWWQPHCWVNRRAVLDYAPRMFSVLDGLMKEEEWTSERLTELIHPVACPTETPLGLPPDWSLG